MQIFAFQFIELFLVEHAFVPKPVRFLVKFFLEMTGKHLLYLTCIGITLVK